jgi:hypothetical protein
MGDEKFVGSFASWGKVKTNYGAAGNGITDDTAAAIPKPLDVPGPDNPTLSFPAGTGCRVSQNDPARTHPGRRKFAISGSPFAVSLFLSAAAMAAGPNAINGVCGPAIGVPTTTAPTSGLCRAGTATAVTGSDPWFWQCQGQKGGSTASCSAPLAASSPPPSLTLTISPLNPIVSQTAPLGTFVATAAAAWSDGSPFTGTIQFTAPYYDDGGTFALSGNKLIISPLGLGVNGDGGTTQRVSLIAVQ